jgi:hypothetical protein
MPCRVYWSKTRSERPSEETPKMAYRKGEPGAIMRPYGHVILANL